MSEISSGINPWQAPLSGPSQRKPQVTGPQKKRIRLAVLGFVFVWFALPRFDFPLINIDLKPTNREPRDFYTGGFDPEYLANRREVQFNPPVPTRAGLRNGSAGESSQ